MRAAAVASAPAQDSQEPGEQIGSLERRHRIRIALLIAIPILAIGAAAAAVHFLESKPAAGIILLLGAALWITVLAVNLGQDIPRRDRLRYQGLNFGRKS